MDPALERAGRTRRLRRSLAVEALPHRNGMSHRPRRARPRAVRGTVVAAARAGGAGLGGLGGPRDRIRLLPGDARPLQPHAPVLPPRLEGSRGDDLARARPVPRRRAAPLPAPRGDDAVHGHCGIYSGGGAAVTRGAHGVAEYVHGRHVAPGHGAPGSSPAVRR